MEIIAPLLLLAGLLVMGKAMIIVPAVIHGKHVRKVRRQA